MSPAGRVQSAEGYGKVPLSFEPNRGQTDERVQWVARGPEYALFLSGHDAVLELNSISPAKGVTDRPKIDSLAVRMNLLGAKTVESSEGEEAQPGKANYFTGRDASKWLREVPMFGKVRLHEVYPGIDLVYYGKQGRLEYDFVVSPGADPAKIGLRFDGAKAGLAANGDLALAVSGAEGWGGTKEIRFDRPTVYQVTGGLRRPVEGAFHVGHDGKVSFALGDYDKTRELVIDPTLIFAGNIATGNQQTIPTGMAVDNLGEMVITGYTNDLTFPVTTGALQTNCQTYSTAAAANGYVRCGPSSSTSGFVTKLSADGSSLIYSTYLHGGGGEEQGHSVAVDAAGDAYILGSTSSNDFPVTSNAYQSLCLPFYSTGGNFAPVLPITAQCDNFANGGGTEYTVNGPTLFIAELNPLGTALIYSTFFGGSQAAYPVGIALDSAGNMIFASEVNQARSAANLYPNSTQIPFPTTGSGYQTTGIDVQAPALSKLSADGQTLMYSTFLGSQTQNVGHDSYNQAFTLGQNDVAFLGGFTDTSDFPTTAGSIKPTCGLNENDSSFCATNQGFVAAIDTTKSGAASLVYASYLGGEEQQGSNIPEQEVYGLAADASNDLFVTGYTSANDFPSTAGVYQPHCNDVNPTGNCNQTAFLSKINPTGTALTWSTLLGDTRDDGPGSYGASIALDADGRVYLYGLSDDGSGDFPQVNPISSYTGGNKVFLAMFSPDAQQLLFSTRFSGPSNNAISVTPIANGLVVDAADNMYIAGYSGDSGSFGTTPGTYSTPATAGFNRAFFTKISPLTPPMPANGLTGNLLANPGAELGSLADWTAGGNGTPRVDNGTYDSGINPHTGSYDFVGGYSSGTDSLSQTVSIIQQGITAAQVDGGTLFANVSFWEQGLAQGTPSDDGSVTLTFLDANGVAIPSTTVTTSTVDSHDGTWANGTGVYAIPVGTRSITYTMNFVKNQMTDNDAFLDDNLLTIQTNTGLTIFPGTLHFGNVAVGNRSAAQTVSVTNQGATAITIEQVASELGANPADFVQTNNCPVDPAVLAAGASCQITVTFVPGGVGYKLAGVDLPDDTPPNDQYVRVDGTGTGGILQVNPGNLKTIAGTGVAGTTGNGGPATAAELNQPNGVAFDPSGNLYIADGPANVVRKVDTNGTITTFAGVGTGGFTGDGGPAIQAELLDPASVTSDVNGNIYIQDSLNFVIRKVTAATGIITTIAGTPQTPGHSGDGGPATAARFNQNQGARFDSVGNLFVPTCRGASIRKIDTAGNISTVAGNFTEGYSGDGGPAVNAQLQCPSGVAIDAVGNLYIADASNNVIRKMTAATGIISTIAGSTVGNPGSTGDGGAATAALLNLPNDVSFDGAGNLYIADSANNRVRKIDTNGIITTAAGGLNNAGSAAVNTPLGLTTDAAGNVYFSDSGNSAVREIFPQGVQPFPPTRVGTTSAAQSLTLSNIGNTDVTLSANGAFTTSGNAGDFALTPGSCSNGTVLTANGGSCAVSITFTPTAVGQRTLTVMIADNALNTPQSFSIGGTGTAAVTPVTPTITWAMPAAITTATPLSATQLDATATDANENAVPGTYVYTPAAGAMLAAGTQTLSVTFTPTDLTNFTTATGSTTIAVTQASGTGAATTTTLTVLVGENTVTTVAAGTVVALSATVTAGTAAVAPGRVAFCDATATSCTDNHLLGTAQLITSMGGRGTATFRFVPGIGTHSYKAVFLGTMGSTVAGTTSAAGSASAAAPLAVTGLFPSATTIAQSGAPGSYMLTATTVGIGDPAATPTGTVSFLDSSNNNAVLATGTLGAGTAGLGFAGKSSTANMENPQTRSVVADFNGDGILDIATANTAPASDPTPTIYANTVTISLGNGDGTFTTLNTYPATGNHPQSIAAGDFNGDGTVDLAVTNIGDGTVTILLGNGDGTFTAGTTVSTARNAYGLVAGDFNGDGNLDLAISAINEVVILLGNGDGSFTATPISLTDGSTAGNEAFGPIITGDFNGDGKADLIVEGYSPAGELIVLLGNGDGSFAAGTPTTLPGQGSNLNGLVAGDFNGDGKVDFAATNSAQNTILIMIGNGDGTFVMTAAASATDYDPSDIQAGDFDGDGKLDLAVQRYSGQEVLLGNGDGTFTVPAIPTGLYAYNAVVVGDFNGDGVPDLAGTDGSANLQISLTQRTNTATVAATAVPALSAGTHNVVASFPRDANYSASVSSATSLMGTGAAAPVTPTITWATPAPITTATPLSATQLDAAATDANGNAVPGTFVYTPAAGALLSAGTQTLSVTFTPTDLTNFTTATGSTTIAVTQASGTATTNTMLTITPGTAVYEQPVTLSAVVKEFNGTPVTRGQVYFCETTAGACNLQTNVGVAQLNGSATAVLRLSPGTIGTHNYTANFAGTNLFVKSGSYSQYVIVTGKYPTATTIAQSGTAGNYTLTATTVGTGSVTVAPTGMVSFQDTSNANAVLATGTLGTAVTALSFANGSNNPASVGAGLAVPGDLNGDGKLDLVFTNRVAGTLTILLGNQDGTFSAAPDVTTGAVPAAVALADFNNDGILDIAVVNQSDSTVSILLGRGDGTFTAVATTPVTGAYPTGIVAGDFNGDGVADLVVTNQNDATVTILLGNGDGTFSPAEPFETGNTPGAIVAGDFNGDGKLDLAIAVTNAVNVYLGRGDGSFALSTSTATNALSADSVAVADLNKDGKLDLVVADNGGYPDSEGAGGVYVLLGNGDGTFTAAASPVVGRAPSGVVVADLNGDGNPDLAVVNLADSTSTILLGVGDGTFTPAATVTTGNAPTSVVSADMNGDGHADLVIATEGFESQSGPTVSVLLTQLTQTAVATATGVSPVGAGAHAVDASYPGDAGYGASVSGATSLTGTGAAAPVTPTITWATPAAITTATPLSATQLDALATDANGAAVPGSYLYTPRPGALLAAGTQTLRVVFTPNDATAFTTATGMTTVVVTQAASATTGTTLSVTSNDQVVTTVAAGSVVILSAQVTAGDAVVTPGQVAFCDATAVSCIGSHLLAIAQVTGRGTANFTFVPGIGAHSYQAVFLGTNAYNGSASTASTLAVTGTYPTATTIAQSGTAGNYSLTATTVGTGSSTVAPTGTVSFLDTSNANAVLGTNPLGSSTPGFSVAQGQGSPVAVGSGAYGVATGDFNGDGFADVVVENYNAGTVSVLLGKGDGTFQPQVTYAVGSEPERVLVADLNGDGNLDLVVANTASGTIGVLLGNGDGTFQPQATYPCGSPVGLGVMDINRDGIPDVVVGDYYNNTMSVLLGNGDGTLKAAVTYATGGTPQTIAEGDFNGDGRVDVVVGNESGATVGVFLGNGDGTFQAMVPYAVGNGPQGVQVGDFNADGKQDLAVSNQIDGTVSVLLGNGDGTFQTQVTYAVGVQPVGLAIADFNGDGIEDITVGNTGQASLTQGVLLGRGDGTFQPQVTFATGNFPYGVAVADFNGDGLPDMAVTNFNDATATILLSQATETAVAAVTGISPTTGTHAIVASYAGDAHYGTSLSQATNLVVAGPTTPVITWTPTVATIPFGTALGAQQLNATASTAAGVVIPGTFVYTPPAGTVLTAGTQTLSVVFTPTDAVNFTTATASVQIVVGGLSLTSFSPLGAVIGSADTSIILKGSGFVNTSMVEVNGTGIPTTYVNGTTLAAVIPAALLTKTGALAVMVLDPSIGATTGAQTFTVLPPTGAATLSGPTTTDPGSQPTVTLSITNPYPVALTAEYSLAFASGGATTVDDPSIQFSSGGRTYSYMVAANSTSVPPVQLQAGTDAGTITITAKLMADGVDVTPAGLAPLVIVVPPVVPVISGTTTTATGTTLTVVVHGFSNTREVSSASFNFTAATGDVLGTPSVTIPATTIFGNWFGDATSVAYGSTFTYTQIFNTSADASTIGSVQVTLTNSVGTSVESTSTGP